MNYISSEKGFVVSFLTFFIVIIMLSVALSMSSLIFYRQKIATYSVASTQSYYAAEAGIEDALMRLNNNPGLAAISYNITVGSSSAAVTIPNIVQGARSIVSEGNISGVSRKIQTVYSMKGQGISFNYGAQVGEGGLVMNNGSRIKGSVFANGNISGGSGTIDNDAIVAKNQNSIKNVTVKGNAKAYSCLSPAVIEGNLTYVTGGTKTCSVLGTTSTQNDEILPQAMPISQSQIDQWKADATSGGLITGNHTITNGATESLGPVKITGKLTVSNNATLNITGVIYVLGDIVFDNNANVKLDGSYNSSSGTILADGKIQNKNNAKLNGSGKSGSYLLLLSNNSDSEAINIDNNATGAIFYTSNGGIKLQNNVKVKEVTGYKITLDNNAVIEYESGLINLFFSSGPSGSWEVLSWEEQ